MSRAANMPDAKLALYLELADVVLRSRAALPTPQQHMLHIMDHFRANELLAQHEINSAPEA